MHFEEALLCPGSEEEAMEAGHFKSTREAKLPCFSKQGFSSNNIA
jgi:hypothetical protein